MKNNEKSDAKRSLFSSHLPLTLAIVTLFVMIGFQTLQLLREWQSLHETKDGQVAAYSEARNIRIQFEAIANGTANLAQSGNQNASAIVAALNEAGVTFNINDPSGD